MILGALVLIFLFYVFLHGPSSILLYRLSDSIYHVRQGNVPLRQAILAAPLSTVLPTADLVTALALSTVIYLRSPLPICISSFDNLSHLPFNEVVILAQALIPGLLGVAVGLLQLFADRQAYDRVYLFVHGARNLLAVWFFMADWRQVVQHNTYWMRSDSDELPPLWEPLAYTLVALEAGSLIWYYTGSPSTTVGQVLGLSFQAPRTPRTPSETLSPESVQPEAEEEEDPEMAAQNRAQARLRAAQAAESRAQSTRGASSSSFSRRAPTRPVQPAGTLLGNRTPLRDAVSHVEAGPPEERPASQKGALAQKLAKQQRKTQAEVLREVARENRRRAEMDRGTEFVEYN